MKKMAGDPSRPGRRCVRRSLNLRMSTMVTEVSSTESWSSPAAMATGSIFIALIRTRSPERCTVPSTIPSTLRSRAISGSDLVVCLYCIEEVRDMTLRVPIRAKSVIDASVMPSEKYSGAGSPERFVRGSGNREEMLQRMAALAASGVQIIALLALSDQGSPAFDHDIAGALVSFGIPAFACTPDLFPDLMSAAIARRSLSAWASEQGIAHC